MPNHKNSNDLTVDVWTKEDREESEKKTFLNYFALALATFGVGYISLAPGTWGSAVGIIIYVLYAWAEKAVDGLFVPEGWENLRIAGWNHFTNLSLLLLFCFLGIWAAGRAALIFQKKDPQKVVVDEVMGQLIVFIFVPLNISWKLILTGFLLFRLFDIWKPYPVKEFENLPKGLGICTDDIVAGIYGGIILSLIYIFSFYF